MSPWWQSLLADLQRTQFAELAGAHATLHLPIPDHIVGEAVTARLAPDALVRTLDVKAHAGNQFTVRVRLRKPALLPPIQLRFRIEQQPRLPASAVLVLLLAPTGLGALAGPALRLLDSLPAGIAIDGHRIRVDLRIIARQYGMAAFDYLTALEITTEDGRIIAAGAAALPPTR